MKRSNWAVPVVVAAMVGTPVVAAERDPCPLHHEYVPVSEKGDVAATDVEIDNESSHQRLWVKFVWPDLGPERSSKSLRLAYSYGLCISSQGAGGPAPVRVGPLAVPITHVFLVVEDPDCKGGRIKATAEPTESAAPQKTLLRIKLRDR